MQNIKFLGTSNHFLNKTAVSSMLLSFASSEGFEVDNIEYNFVDSKKMYSLNKDYLDHTTDTDIITFDYSENKIISAEVYISKDMMIENAKENSQIPENECLRLVSHALFHCMGYKDKSPNEKKTMRLKEEEFISAVSRETKLDV
jgi:probable rRNA maturation factor